MSILPPVSLEFPCPFCSGKAGHDVFSLFINEQPDPARRNRMTRFVVCAEKACRFEHTRLDEWFRIRSWAAREAVDLPWFVRQSKGAYFDGAALRERVRQLRRMEQQTPMARARDAFFTVYGIARRAVIAILK